MQDDLHSCFTAIVAHPCGAIFIDTFALAQRSRAHDGSLPNMGTRKQHHTICDHGSITDSDPLRSKIVCGEDLRARPEYDVVPDFEQFWVRTIDT